MRRSGCRWRVRGAICELAITIAELDRTDTIQRTSNMCNGKQVVLKPNHVPHVRMGASKGSVFFPSKTAVLKIANRHVNMRKTEA